MSNVVQLMTPGPRRSHLSRTRMTLGCPVMLYGPAAIASLMLNRGEHGLEAHFMGMGELSSLPVEPGEQLELSLDGHRLVMWVRAIGDRVALVDFGKEPSAPIRLAMTA